MRERSRALFGTLCVAPSEAWTHRVQNKKVLQVVSIRFQQTTSAIRASRSSKKIAEREQGYRGGAAAPSEAGTHRVLIRKTLQVVSVLFQLHSAVRASRSRKISPSVSEATEAAQPPPATRPQQKQHCKKFQFCFNNSAVRVPR